MAIKDTLYGGGHASEQDIAALEQATGRVLPESFRRFVDGNDGAAPDGNIFEVAGNGDASVDHFLPVAEIPYWKNLAQDLPLRAFPIAADGCGNYVVIGEGEQGPIFFWDHETGSLTKLAETLEQFLTLLQPFDPESVTLEPGQVIRTWIDPAFKAELERSGQKDRVPETADGRKSWWKKLFG